MSGTLGYKWYPQDWWTSDMFFDLEDDPLLRYVCRELFDLLYMSGGKYEVTLSQINRRFRVGIMAEELKILEGYFVVDEEGFWSHEKVDYCISMIELARENGRLGGAPIGNKNASKKGKNNPNNRGVNRGVEPKTTPPLSKKQAKEKEKEKVKEERVEAPVKPEASVTYLDSSELLIKLKEQFPKKNVPLELEKMKDWLKSNGRRKKDYLSFARNWLREAKPNRQQQTQNTRVVL